MDLFLWLIKASNDNYFFPKEDINDEKINKFGKKK